MRHPDANLVHGLYRDSTRRLWEHEVNEDAVLAVEHAAAVLSHVAAWMRVRGAYAPKNEVARIEAIAADVAAIIEVGLARDAGQPMPPVEGA